MSERVVGGGGMEEAVQLMRAPWLKGVNREWHCGGGTLRATTNKNSDFSFLLFQTCCMCQVKNAKRIHANLDAFFKQALKRI